MNARLFGASLIMLAMSSSLVIIACGPDAELSCSRVDAKEANKSWGCWECREVSGQCLCHRDCQPTDDGHGVNCGPDGQSQPMVACHPDLQQCDNLAMAGQDGPCFTLLGPANVDGQCTYQDCQITKGVRSCASMTWARPCTAPNP